MKKITSLALALALLCGMVGCSDEKKGKEGDTNIPTLTIYMPGSEQADLPIVLEEANKIAEKEIGAKIDITFFDFGAYSEKLNMMLATKDEFDVCFTGFVNPYSKGVQNESYYPLTELINKNCPELWDTMPQFWWDAVKRDGEFYAVPNQQIASTVGAITMNTDWVKKYNLDVDSIKTIDDIEPFLQTIKDNEPDYYPTRPFSNYWVKNYEGIAGNVGLDLSADGYKAIYAWEADGYETGMKKLREWFKKGYFREDVASVMDDTNDFYANKYVVTGTGWKPGFEASQSSILGGEHIAIKIQEPYINSSGVIATMYAINAYTKHPDHAIKFINLVNTNKEFYNLLAFGIEGKHYEWVDDTHIKPNPDSGYYPNASWAFGNQFNAYLLEGQEDTVWEETIKFNEESRVSPIIDFVFDNSNVQTELSQIATVSQEYANLSNGSMDWAVYGEEYKQKMFNAGIENVLKEVQRQLDEYAKSK